MNKFMKRIHVIRYCDGILSESRICVISGELSVVCGLSFCHSSVNSALADVCVTPCTRVQLHIVAAFLVRQKKK